MMIEQDEIRYLQLKKNSKFEVERKGHLPLAENLLHEGRITDKQAFQTLLQTWVREENLKGESVTISIPTSIAMIRRLKVPDGKPKEIRNLVELEVNTTLQLPFDDPVFDYVELGDSDQDGKEVLVFAAPRNLVMEYVGLLEEAGVKVKAVDLPLLALIRVIEKQQSTLPDDLLILYATNTQLEILMMHKQIPIFMRSVHIHENQMYGETHAMLTWSAEEMETEISRMLGFYQYTIHEGERYITDIMILGPHHGMEQLLSHLQSVLPLLQTQEVRLHSLNARLRELGLLDYAIPLGLALKKGKIRR
jgi:type IV pilus assembly protein PilN